MIATPEQKQTEIILTNPTGITQQLKGGINLGHASEVEVISHASLNSGMDDTGKIPRGGGNDKEADHLTSVLTVKILDAASRKEKLGKLLAEVRAALKWQDKDKLLQFLLKNRQVFALDEEERGETNLVQMTIDTGEAESKQVPPCRTLLAARQEITTQLKQIQDQRVKQPLCGPWACPVVLVRKKDGTMRFCIARLQTTEQGDEAKCLSLTKNF